MKSLDCLTRRLLQGSYWLWVLIPLPCFGRKLLFLLNIILRCIWIAYLCYLLALAIGFLYTAPKLIGAYVGTFLLMGNICVGLLLIFESVLKQSAHCHLENLCLQSELLLQRLGMCRGRGQVNRLMVMIGFLLICDMIRSWANHGCNINPIHGFSMPKIWLLRLRYVQLLEHVMDLNQRSVQLRCSLNALAEGNDLWQPYGLQECRQLQILRLSYERIFECYEVFSDCYGWGMLGLQLIIGFEFVSNAYWMLEAWMSNNHNILVFIYNSITTLSMGILILALFWYGDAGAENLTLMDGNHLKALSSYFLFDSLVIMFTSHWSQVLSRSFLKLFFLIVCLFGVGSFKHRRGLHLILLCIWLCWYIFIWIFTLHRNVLFRKDCKLDCTLEQIMFISQTLSHTLIIIHIFLQGDCHSSKETPRWRDRRIASLVVGMLIPILVVHSMVTYFKIINTEQDFIVFYWRSVPSKLGLQVHLIAFIADIFDVNSQVKLARRQLQMLARPKQRIYWQKSNDMDQLTNQVKLLKLRYNELYNLFDRLNFKYGASLLIIFIVFFLDFVSNSYWVFYELTRGLHIMILIEHFGFLFNISVQLSITCWHCQQSFNLGRQIGCLISKLIKPMGSKRYNNLVCEFSLQTLHQRFVITAKDFFSLNLHLLSSMFAAVVTYLVILIQFMFAESTSRN